MVELVGTNVCFDGMIPAREDAAEVLMRVGVREDDRRKADRVGMELASLITSGPPGPHRLRRADARVQARSWPTGPRSSTSNASRRPSPSRRSSDAPYRPARRDRLRGSGDKGDDANVGIWAKSDAAYAVMRDTLTTERIKEHFAAVCEGSVTRYELPNLRALNFILGNSLAGGGSGSMRTDAQGKTFGRGLLYMEIEVPDDFAG